MFGIHWPLHVVKRVAVGIIVLAVLLTGTLVGYNWWEEKQKRCEDEPHVWKKGTSGECIGFTSGPYAFGDDKLKKVTKLIDAENKRIDEKNEDFVTVAYLTTFTPDDDASNSKESVRRELQGAYLAQMRRNDGDRKMLPKFKLIMANTGSDSRYANGVAKQLIRWKKQENLVAVTGMGPSSDRAKAAINSLSKKGIPSVASTITASDIKDIESFVRVAPPNDAQAEAAAEYVRKESKEKGGGKVAVLKDKNKDNSYAKTLADAFTRKFEDEENGFIKDPENPLTFNSSRDGGSDPEFDSVVVNLCEEDPKPAMVYFAGRGSHLKNFIISLSERNSRPCLDHEFTVIAGDDTTNLTKEEVRNASERDIRVVYTGLSHPDMWEDSSREVTKDLADEFQTGGRMAQWFPEDSRDDGQAIMGHDAVATVSQAVNQITSSSGKVTGPEIGRQFDQIRGEHKKVRGASGRITFDPHGLPENKSVPILEMQKNGSAKLLERWTPGTS